MTGTSSGLGNGVMRFIVRYRQNPRGPAGVYGLADAQILAQMPQRSPKGQAMAPWSGRWLGPNAEAETPGRQRGNHLGFAHRDEAETWKGRYEDVPSLMRCVRTAAAAKGRQIIRACHTCGHPRPPECPPVLPRSIMASAPVLSRWVLQHNQLLVHGFSHFLFIMIPIILLQPQAPHSWEDLPLRSQITPYAVPS